MILLVTLFLVSIFRNLKWIKAKIAQARKQAEPYAFSYSRNEALLRREDDDDFRPAPNGPNQQQSQQKGGEFGGLP